MEKCLVKEKDGRTKRREGGRKKEKKEIHNLFTEKGAFNGSEG